MKIGVSVILPTYNGASRGHLSEAIESVLSQTYRNIELVIVDDGSTDNTGEVCAGYTSDGRVRYVRKENEGLADARNTGMENSNGEYICFLDDDDIWKAEKVEKQLEFFRKERDKKTGMVFTHIDLIDEDGREYGTQAHRADGDVYRRLFYENIVDSPSSVMLRRDVIAKTGEFKGWMKSCEDYDYWFRVAREYHIYSVNEPLVQYRVHRNKMSADLEKMEFFQNAALHYALRDAPEEIKEEENRIYNNSYQLFARKYFFDGKYREFRRACKEANTYKRGIAFNLRVKYVLSYFPWLLNVAKKLRGYLKRENPNSNTGQASCIE